MKLSLLGISERAVLGRYLSKLSFAHWSLGGILYLVDKVETVTKVQLFFPGVLRR